MSLEALQRRVDSLERIRYLHNAVEAAKHDDEKSNSQIDDNDNGAAAAPSIVLPAIDDAMRRAREAVERAGCYSAVWKWVPSDYYQRPLSQRASVCLQASSVHALCKSLLLENKKAATTTTSSSTTSSSFTTADTIDPTNPRYIMVIVQYNSTLNVKKLVTAMRKLRPDAKHRLDESAFDYRMAEDAVTLTGYTHNAVTPFGCVMASSSSNSSSVCHIPIVLTEAVVPLKFFWMGGGHVHLKLGMSVTDFVRAMKPIVIADISDPRSSSSDDDDGDDVLVMAQDQTAQEQVHTTATTTTTTTGTTTTSTTTTSTTNNVEQSEEDTLMTEDSQAFEAEPALVENVDNMAKETEVKDDAAADADAAALDPSTNGMEEDKEQVVAVAQGEEEEAKATADDTEVQSAVQEQTGEEISAEGEKDTKALEDTTITDGNETTEEADGDAQKQMEVETTAAQDDDVVQKKSEVETTAAQDEDAVQKQTEVETTIAQDDDVVQKQVEEVANEATQGPEDEPSTETRTLHVEEEQTAIADKDTADDAIVASNAANEAVLEEETLTGQDETGQDASESGTTEETTQGTTVTEGVVPLDNSTEKDAVDNDTKEQVESVGCGSQQDATNEQIESQVTEAQEDQGLTVESDKDAIDAEASNVTDIPADTVESIETVKDGDVGTEPVATAGDVVQTPPNVGGEPSELTEQEEASPAASAEEPFDPVDNVTKTKNCVGTDESSKQSHASGQGGLDDSSRHSLDESSRHSQKSVESKLADPALASIMERRRRLAESGKGAAPMNDPVKSPRTVSTSSPRIASDLAAILARRRQLTDAAIEPPLE